MIKKCCLIIYILILIIINFKIKNLNLIYCIISVLNLNFLIESSFKYKKNKDKINLIESIACFISLLSLITLILIK